MKFRTLDVVLLLAFVAMSILIGYLKYQLNEMEAHCLFNHGACK